MTAGGPAWGGVMYGQYRKIDPAKVLQLKSQGLSNAQIARRLGVTEAAVSYALNKAKNSNGMSERLRS